jgi:hypothetical protein
MTATKFEKQLQKIDRDHEKVVEVLERVLGAVRNQAAAAQEAAQQTRQEIGELEEKRPQLALASFSGGADEQAELEDLEKSIGELRRRVDLAELAEDQAVKAIQGIEERLKAATREVAEKRYDLLAEQRKEQTVALDDTLVQLTELANGLIELDQRQRAEEQRLGFGAGDMPYQMLLDTHLRCKLQRHIAEAGRSIVGLSNREIQGSLLSKDHRTKTLGEARSENEAEVELAERQTAKREAFNQAKDRRDRYELRKAEIYARYGAPRVEDKVPGGLVRHSKVDDLVNATLAREFPDIVQAEQQETAAIT